MMTQKEKIGFYSIGVNVLLVALKGGLAVLSGSVALVADAIHSATDVISSVTVLAGIKISKRKSKNFPYGLYKVENFVSLLTSLFIFLAGYEIVKTAFFKPFTLKTQYLPYAMGGLVAAMAITFAGEEKGKGIKVSEWLLAKGVDTVYTPKGFEGKGPGYVFSDGGVDVKLTGGRNLAAIQHEIQKKTGGMPPLNHELKGEKGDD